MPVRPCSYCGWHFGSHRRTGTLPIGPPRSTSRKMVLFVPRPWYRCCCRHNWQATLWHALLSWPCKMSAPFLLSTTWWAHNPQFHRIETWLSCTPLYPRLFLARGLVCNLRATFLVINSGIGHNTYSRCSEPLSHSVSGNERLPIRLKLLIAPSYFALDVFHLFNWRDSHVFIHGITPDDYPL